MASPLLVYANAVVRVQDKGAVSVVNGRLTEVPGGYYLFKCYLKRIQYTGVSTGSVKQPLPSQMGGTMMPGASGDQFLYRGYYLEKASVASDFDWRGDLSGLTWIATTAYDDLLKPGSIVQFALGETPTMQARVERSTGIFGGAGIDTLIYQEIGGVQLQLSGAELLN